MNLWSLVERRAAATPDANMLADENSRHVSFGQFKAMAERISAALAAQGVITGTAVTWQLPSTVETLALTAALARLGAVQNPVIPGYGQRNLDFVTAQTGCEFLFTSVDEVREWGLAGGAAVPPPAGPASPGTGPGSGPARWVFYTSGTTADPKGALHTDASVLASSAGLARAMALVPADRVGAVFPVAHIGGCGTWLGACLLSGCALILDSDFDLERTAELQRREGVTIAGCGTVFTQLYTGLQRRNPDRRLFPAARLLTGGASPRPPGLHEEVKRVMGTGGMLSGYGMTEAPILTMAAVTDPDEKIALTEGRPCPGVELITSGGELRAKAPQLMLGYLDPELNAGAFDADGYLRTGDLGEIDADGYVRITGRLKDVIIRKGETISARAIEMELLTFPGLDDAAVIGVPDAARTELACAVVIPADPARPPSLEAVVAHLRSRGVPPAQWPERLEVVPDFPRNSTGKVRKDELRSRVAPESR